MLWCYFKGLIGSNCLTRVRQLVNVDHHAIELWEDRMLVISLLQVFLNKVGCCETVNDLNPQ
jgi:hypothetical protein